MSYLALTVLFLQMAVLRESYKPRKLEWATTNYTLKGKAKITAFEFTVPVGSPEIPHTHSFPVLIIIKEGGIELLQGEKNYIY